ncbi:MAG: GTPase HflX [bacterium]
MHDIKDNKPERAILVAVRTGETTREVLQEHIDELELLVKTAGAETIFKIVQDRQRYDTAYFIGKGKAEELANLVELNEINLIIFDDDLTATQVRNLENLINKKIIDRSALILDIFASHARTNEAKTQVEFAQLQYMMTRLTRAWTHLSKQYGGIGTKGPGETQIETDRRIIRTRISKLKERLKKIESEHITTSAKRKEFLKASLVGYTNAGKSTILNLLTGAGVLAEDKLFATLDSTTRALELEKNKKILISDTVGFIRKLPHNLVASFKTTLNVVREADIILHVIDITNDYFEDHIKVVDDTLKELYDEKKIVIHIFNKVDALIEKSRIDYVLHKYEKSIVISAERGINVSALKVYLVKIYEDNFNQRTITLDIHESKKVSLIHKYAEVIKTAYGDEKVTIIFRANPENANKILRLINEK